MNDHLHESMTERDVIDQKALEELDGALQGFRGAPSHETFMDIAGYKEATFSNVLAFYLDPEAGHGLGDLLPKALLECVGRDEDFSSALGSGEVDTECSTERGGRIDIVAEYDELVIGIENKLWSAVGNDLKDYGKTIDKLAEDRDAVKILLAPDKKDPWAGFEAVTYQQLFEKVKRRLDDHLHLPSKYITYLVDMFYTLCKPPNPMEEERLVRFFSENFKAYRKIREMYQKTRKMYAQMRPGILEALNRHEGEFENTDIARKIGGRLKPEGLKLGMKVHTDQTEVGVIYYSMEGEKHGKYKGCAMEVHIWCDRPNPTWNLQVMGVRGIEIEEIQAKLSLGDWTVVEKKAKLRKYDVYPLDKFDEANKQALQIFLGTLDLIDQKAS